MLQGMRRGILFGIRIWILFGAVYTHIHTAIGQTTARNGDNIEK